MRMNLHTRPRGLIGAPMNNANPDVAAMMAAFDRYNAQASTMATRLAEINGELDSLNQRLAGGRVGADTAVPRGVNKHDSEAFMKFLRSGVASAPSASMATDSNPDGGYITGRTIDTVIQDQLVNLSPMRRYARVVSYTGGQYYFFVNRRGTSSGWVAERDARPETNTPQFGALNPPSGEIYAEPKVSQFLLDDSFFDLEGFLNENISTEFAVQEGAAFVSGDGINKPQGFLTKNIVSTTDATRAFGDLQYFPSGGASGFASTNPGDPFLDMVYGLSGAYRTGPGVAWMMNSTTIATIRKFKDNTGWYLWQPAMALGQPETFCGFPIAVNENMPSIAGNAYPIAFGNWQLGYRIADRFGIRILRDPYTSKPNVLFYATKRLGGIVADSNAIKLMKIATS